MVGGRQGIDVPENPDEDARFKEQVISMLRQVKSKARSKKKLSLKDFEEAEKEVRDMLSSKPKRHEKRALRRKKIFGIKSFTDDINNVSMQND